MATTPRQKIHEEQRVPELNLTGLIERFQQMGVHPDAVTISDCKVSWDRDETAQEQTDREAEEKAAADLVEAEERAEYEVLKEKYGP